MVVRWHTLFLVACLGAIVVAVQTARVGLALVVSCFVPPRAMHFDTALRVLFRRPLHCRATRVPVIRRRLHNTGGQRPSSLPPLHGIRVLELEGLVCWRSFSLRKTSCSMLCGDVFREVSVRPLLFQYDARSNRMSTPPHPPLYRSLTPVRLSLSPTA
jgi:hypothetical protein